MIITSSGQPLLITPVDQKLRDLKTLKQHYYPEVPWPQPHSSIIHCGLQGGWGWVVIIVAFLVHFIAIGAQVCKTPGSSMTSLLPSLAWQCCW